MGRQHKCNHDPKRNLSYTLLGLNEGLKILESVPVPVCCECKKLATRYMYASQLAPPTEQGANSIANTMDPIGFFYCQSCISKSTYLKTCNTCGLRLRRILYFPGAVAVRRENKHLCAVSAGEVSMTCKEK